MNEKETLEYNKRCAEFLGWKNLNDDSFPEYVNPSSFYDFHPLRKLKFHSDWNWIMEVVEVIVRIPNNNSSDTTLQTRKRDVQYILMSTQKEAVVGAINQFLIWYEQNKNIFD